MLTHRHCSCPITSSFLQILSVTDYICKPFAVFLQCAHLQYAHLTSFCCLLFCLPPLSIWKSQTRTLQWKSSMAHLDWGLSKLISNSSLFRLLYDLPICALNWSISSPIDCNPIDRCDWSMVQLSLSIKQFDDQTIRFRLGLEVIKRSRLVIKLGDRTWWFNLMIKLTWWSSLVIKLTWWSSSPIGDRTW